MDDGIAAIQGAPTLPAGNTFSGIAAAGGDFFNDSNNGITYFYYDGAADEEPVNYSGMLTPIALNEDNTCQPDEPDGPVIHINPEAIEEIYNLSRTDFNGLRSTYDSLLNGGIDKSVWVNQAASLSRRLRLFLSRTSLMLLPS